MSDVSVIPPASLPLLACRDRLELLVLDCTFVTRPINSHVSLQGSLEIVRALRPLRTLLTGLTRARLDVVFVCSLVHFARHFAPDDFDYDFWSRTLQMNFARNAPHDGVVTVTAFDGASVDIALPPFDVDLSVRNLSRRTAFLCVERYDVCVCVCALVNDNSGTAWRCR